MAFDQITIAPALQGAARVGILQMDGLRVQETPEELKAMLNGLAEEFARKYKDEPLGEIAAVQKVRAIFHRAGLDPTRYRPSSESLLRRAVKGKGLYFINSVVDLLEHFPLLADQEGPFGSLVSDSMRSRVTEECTRILWITFAPPGTDIPLDEFSAAMISFNGGATRLSTQI